MSRGKILMCGITGILECGASRSTAARLEATVLRMANGLRHRGPDGAGAWVDASIGIGLGHRRLAIIDLSERSHQPMGSQCGRYVVSFNGEIYNFRVLRAELESCGHRFFGASDCEVLLSAFTQWGVEAALQRFNGMFAFAVWDRQLRRLHLVRDRFGEKPLYYGLVNGVFLFGSELKALRLHPEFKGKVDRKSLRLFLRYGYVPTPHSIYDGVYKLSPSTILTVDSSRSLNLQVRQYWCPRQVAQIAARKSFTGSLSDAAEAAGCLLSDSVRLRTVADVPVGAFLSGGIDSSLIVALMQAGSGDRVKTFTVGFGQRYFDESKQARRVAEILGTDHVEQQVSAEQALAAVLQLSHLYDEPFADSSQIPTYLVSTLARESVTVSLSGDGGDEIFGGYDHYRSIAATWRSWQHLSAGKRQELVDYLSGLASARDWNGSRLYQIQGPAGMQLQIPGSQLKTLADALPRLQLESVLSLVRTMPEAELLLVDQEGNSGPSLDIADCVHIEDEYGRMMYRDAVTYLPDDILAKVDRASMSVGLEVRAPFLDHRVYELAWTLPPAMKVGSSMGKVVLRRLLERYFPTAMMQGPKLGFRAPIQTWLRGHFRPWAEDLLDQRRLAEDGFLDSERVRRIWAEHLEGRTDQHTLTLWAVLIFQQWLHS